MNKVERLSNAATQGWPDEPTAKARQLLVGFNEKVTRLENTRFYQLYLNEPPNIMMKFDRDIQTEVGPLKRNGGPDGDSPSIELSISGYATAWVEGFDQDAIEAFVLTYRLLTQNNDRYSVRNLARLYDSAWIGLEGRACLTHARSLIDADLDQYTTADLGNGPTRKRELVDIVVYGGLAHSNEQKEAVFRAWTQNPTSGAWMWVEFMAILRGLMHYFLYIRDLNCITLHNGFGEPVPAHLLHLDPTVRKDVGDLNETGADVEPA